MEANRSRAIGSILPAVLCLLLLGPALSGCLGASTGDTGNETTATPDAESPAQPASEPSRNDPSPPTKNQSQPREASLDEILSFSANASDGTTLRGHVYLPNASRPLATILVFAPYLNHGGAQGSDEMDIREDGRRTMIERWGFQALLDNGFAVALVNIRGTGISEGCYSYMNHPVNGPDANAVVDALADEPWSNGHVGMHGLSYGGATQYAAIAHDPSPHLDAVVPVSGEWDEWNLLGRWGAAIDSSRVSHPLRRDIMQGMGLAGTIWGQGEFRPTPEHACEDTLTHLEAYEELKIHGDKTAFYEDRDLREGVRNSSVPIFATNGMTEDEGHILQFEGLWDLVQHDDKRLMVGQWGHGFPFEDADRFTRQYAVPWFDHYLRNGPPVETGAVTYQDGTGTWHNATSWPPGDKTDAALHLSDGRLTENANAVQDGSQRFVTDDEEIPRPDACPQNAAAYVSPPLVRDVRLAGNVLVNLTVTSNSPNENIAAYLWSTSDSHSCEEPTASQGLSNVTRHAWALSDLRHRGHLEQGRPFPLGEPGGLEMRTMPMAEVIPAGARIILTVGAGHPELFPKPGTTVMTVETGSDVTGEVVLPVVEGRLAFVEEPGGSSGSSLPGW